MCRFCSGTLKTIFVPKWSCFQYSPIVSIICSEWEYQLQPIGKVETGTKNVLHLVAPKSCFALNMFSHVLVPKTYSAPKHFLHLLAPTNIFSPTSCFAKILYICWRQKKVLAPTDVDTRRRIVVPERSRIQFSTMVDVICSWLERWLRPISQLDTGTKKCSTSFGAKHCLSPNNLLYALAPTHCLAPNKFLHPLARKMLWCQTIALPSTLPVYIWWSQKAFWRQQMYILEGPFLYPNGPVSSFLQWWI